MKSDIKNEKLLSAGGSLSQEELGKIMVLDICTLDFWKHGIKQYKLFVDELKNSQYNYYFQNLKEKS